MKRNKGTSERKNLTAPLHGVTEKSATKSGEKRRFGLCVPEKIQTKLTAMFLLTAAFVAFINVGMGMAITRYSTTEAVRTNLMETTQVAALAAQNMITTYTSTISEIAAHPLLTDEGSSLQEKQEFLNSRVEAYHMLGYGMADETGYDETNQMDVSQEAFFQEALKGQTYMSQPYFAEDRNTLYLMVSAPVKKENRVVSVIYFQCDTDILQSIVDGVTVGEMGDAYILDKNGTTIANQDLDAVFGRENVLQEVKKNPGDRTLQELAAIEEKMVAGQSGVGEYYYAEEGTSYLQGYAPIPATDGWSIAIGVNENEFMRPANIGVLILLGLFAVTFIVVMCFSVFMGRAIARPIVACSARLKGLAAGDLHSPVPVTNSRDEIGALIDASALLQSDLESIINDISYLMAEMSRGNFVVRSRDQSYYKGDYEELLLSMRGLRDTMDATLHQINAAAEQVDAGSEQMASGSRALAQGAAEQTSSTAELADTVAEINQQIRQAGDYARAASVRTNHVGNMMNECNDQMQGMLAAMNDISHASDQISKIVKAIEDIAFQTNILALNAAVEAARAGEAGKGFAVVADEVRSLAGKSAEASRDTTALIEASITAVDKGAKLAESTAQQIQEASAEAQGVVEMVSKIAVTAQEQADSMKLVTSSIDRISAVVQTNSVTSEEGAEASEKLSEQAAVLKRLVEHFKL